MKPDVHMTRMSGRVTNDPAPCALFPKEAHEFVGGPPCEQRLFSQRREQ